ncbi:MAG TPA: ABC-type transport auxiliary lipoprotein family protein, partial [Allosphingosinicella sp.]|nr:ABC-type transport auxiliary lipoprotein family protein [Allosphingosinicella sp.]
MRLKLLASAVLALALSACFGGGAPSQLLTLSAAQTRPVAAPRSAGQGEAITVAEPAVPQALRVTRIPVYVSDTSIQYLTGAEWVEKPAGLFARLVGETIAARTGRVVLDPAQYSQDPGTRLSGTLVRFGLDPNAMQVVIVYDAAIARGAAGGVTSNRFEARVPVAEATPAAVAPALNDA